MIIKYLRAITPVRVFTGSKSARGIDARIFSGGVLARLPLGLPSQRGPVVRGAWGVPTAPGERRGPLVSVEANSFFSSLRETSVIGGIFPQVGTLIHGAVGTWTPVRDVWAQVRAFAIVAGPPTTVRDRVETTAASRRRPCRIENSAHIRHIGGRRMISQIVIIVGSHAGAAQVWVPKRWARLKLS